MSRFEGRTFLLDAEYETYMRRMPVRYIRQKLESVCFVCGKPPDADNPLERAHRIPFGSGIRIHKLTPDFLDSPENIVSAHRKFCNKSAELSLADVIEKLRLLKS